MGPGSQCMASMMFAATAAATDRTLTSVLRDVVRRERVHEVPKRSDPKHLMHHVSGPTASVTTNHQHVHLKTMANGPSVCAACNEAIGTANACRQHVHYDYRGGPAEALKINTSFQNLKYVSALAPLGLGTRFLFV